MLGAASSLEKLASNDRLSVTPQFSVAPQLASAEKSLGRSAWALRVSDRRPILPISYSGSSNGTVSEPKTLGVSRASSVVVMSTPRSVRLSKR